MEVTTEAFVTSFHSITGTTVGERRKNLFLLLNKFERADSAKLDFSHLHPKTHLEEKFKVESLLYFRKIPELINVLKSENPILIKRVLREFPVLKEVFQNITGEQLVTSIFPYISFNVKVKLLNKLSLHLKDPLQAETLFEAVEKKYGLYLASKLLPACSSELIANYVKCRRIKLTSKQLLIVVEKHPDLAETLFEMLKSRKIDVGIEYRNVFLYFAQNDFEQFLKFCKEYEVTSIRLGWRITDKFIQKNRGKVIKNPQVYYNMLHSKQIPKSLNLDFKDLYFNLFPESLEQFGYSEYHKLFSIVKQLPRRMRSVDLLLTTFEKAYGNPLWAHPDFLGLELFEMLPPEQRDAKIKPEYKPSGVSEEKWNCYMKTERSIPYLKKAISLTSDIKTRIELVRLLVKTCALNIDKIALAHMCKYMLTKHRNNASVRRAFLIALNENFNLLNLKEQHWTLINELIELFSWNRESFDDVHYFQEAFICFRLKHGLPVKENLTDWLKSQGFRLNIVKKEPLYEKQCLLMFGEIISEMFKKGTEDENEELDSRNIEFISTLISWNQRYPADQISIFSYSSAIDSVKRTMMEEKRQYDVEKIIKHCLALETHAAETKVLLNLYLTRSHGYIDVKIVNWLVLHELSTVIDNIDSITQVFLNMSSYRADYFFWRYWKNYCHLESFKKVINMCLSSLNAEEDYSYDKVIKNAVLGLSYLLTFEEFKQFILPYYPLELRANSKTEEDQKTFRIQESIAACLKNLAPASLTLESILIFCKGDYLKLIQRSLYSVCGNVNEDKLPLFLNELSGRAVSVRKHAMHITLRTLPVEHIYSILKKFMETEKNPSVRKFIFKGIFNFFVINADEHSWELVKMNVSALDTKDKEAWEILMQAEKIPRQYFAQYFTFLWDLLSKLTDPECNTEFKKFTLLGFVTPEMIKQLSKELCSGIIQSNFLNCPDGSLTSFSSQINTFTCRYIIYCDSLTEQEERLNVHFEIVKKYVLATWRSSDYDVRVGARNCVTDVLKEFCLEFLKFGCCDTEILFKFAELWNNFFKPHDAFDEYLHLQFVLISVQRLSMPEISRKLADMCDSITGLYGFAVIYMFYKKIKFFERYFLSGGDDVLEENWYILIENLAQPGCSVYCLALVSLLLNDHDPTIPKIKAKYKMIIEMLEKNSDPVVQLYLENHFRRGGTTLDYH